MIVLVLLMMRFMHIRNMDIIYGYSLPFHEFTPFAVHRLRSLCCCGCASFGMCANLSVVRPATTNKQTTRLDTLDVPYILYIHVHTITNYNLFTSRLHFIIDKIIADIYNVP